MHQHQLTCCYHTFARLYLGSGRWDAVGILCEFDFINTRRIFLLDLHHLQVEAELEAFGGVDNVVVERTTNTSVDDFVMYQYTIYFVGKAVAGDVPQIQVVDVGHNGCRATYNATAGQEAETLVDSFIPLYKVQNSRPDLRCHCGRRQGRNRRPERSLHGGRLAKRAEEWVRVACDFHQWE